MKRTTNSAGSYAAPSLRIFGSVTELTANGTGQPENSGSGGGGGNINRSQRVQGGGGGQK